MINKLEQFIFENDNVLFFVKYVSIYYIFIL